MVPQSVRPVVTTPQALSPPARVVPAPAGNLRRAHAAIRAFGRAGLVCSPRGSGRECLPERRCRFIALIPTGRPYSGSLPQFRITGPLVTSFFSFASSKPPGIWCPEPIPPVFGVLGVLRGSLIDRVQSAAGAVNPFYFLIVSNSVLLLFSPTRKTAKFLDTLKQNQRDLFASTFVLPPPPNTAHSHFSEPRRPRNRRSLSPWLDRRSAIVSQTFGPTSDSGYTRFSIFG